MFEDSHLVEIKTLSWALQHDVANLEYIRMRNHGTLMDCGYVRRRGNPSTPHMGQRNKALSALGSVCIGQTSSPALRHGLSKLMTKATTGKQMHVWYGCSPSWVGSWNRQLCIVNGGVFCYQLRPPCLCWLSGSFAIRSASWKTNSVFDS